MVSEGALPMNIPSSINLFPPLPFATRLLLLLLLPPLPLPLDLGLDNSRNLITRLLPLWTLRAEI